MKEVLNECYYCHAPLKLEIAETAIHTYQGQKYRYTVKHQPSLACTKCNNSFQAEPDIGLKKAEIEYKDMIRYVDKVLKFKGDED